MAALIAPRKFRIGGMDCPACASKIETAISRLEGIENVTVSLGARTMTLGYADESAMDRIERQVRSLGYTISPIAGDAPETTRDPGASQDDERWWLNKKTRATLACATALGLAYGLGVVWPAIGYWAFLAALAVGLIPIAWKAVAAAAAGSPFSIETLMTIAAVGAVIIGAAEEAAVVVVLFLVGEFLEGIATARARASIRDLADLVPKEATVEDQNGATRTIQAASLEPGVVIIVGPGERIAADGLILEGQAAIDEAPVSGESVPKSKAPGETVFAGTIVTDAVLRIQVTAAAADNTIARVIRLVEEAQESKAPTERFIDRFSAWYTPAVLALGALVAILPPLAGWGSWQEWIYKGLAILLIGCPCALVISTPAAIAAGLSAGARRGLLLKGGAVLEALRRITVVALDKTGTLTEGRPKVTDIIGLSHAPSDIVAMAAALETGSSHPLAVAILARAAADGLNIPKATNARALAGKGVTAMIEGTRILLGSPRAAAEEAVVAEEVAAQISSLNDQGKTVSVLLVDGVPAGLIAMRDEPRPDAAEGLRALGAAGIETIMLTGDNARTARAIATGLGITAYAGLLPEDKQRIVRERQQRGAHIAKVGDGINDAPALAAADIGIAMGGGTDIALETADAAILHGRVMDIANMVALSKATMGNIAQNITIALGLKGVFLVTTVLGVTGLWPAILADTGATVLVTINAMRLLAWRGVSSAGDAGRAIASDRDQMPATLMAEP